MAPPVVPPRRAAMATLVATEGGSPRPAGSRMWVDEQGGLVGAVTIGGCVDARVIEAAGRTLATGEPALLAMALGDEDAWAIGLTCAGTVEVLVEPVDGGDPGDPVARALAAAAVEVRAGRVAVVVGRLAGPAQRLVVTGAGATGTLGSAALDAAAGAVARGLLADGDSGVRVVEGERLYFERHAPPWSLVVFGATHVAVPLVAMAGVLGLRTTVADGRTRYASRDRFPGADEILVGMPSELADRLAQGPQALVVLLAHDAKYDVPVLQSVLAGEAPYIGVLGGRRRARALMGLLADGGATPAQLARIRMPIGLDLGARSAGEIALSILAEAVAVVRGRPGGSLRERTAP